MTNISTLFPEPGTELVFVRTLPRPRFCVAEGDNIKFDTAVGLHVNEFVYIDGTPFRNLGHAFREEHGNRQIPHQADEHVEVAELAEAARIYVASALNFLKA